MIVQEMKDPQNLCVLRASVVNYWIPVFTGMTESTTVVEIWGNSFRALLCFFVAITCMLALHSRCKHGTRYFICGIRVICGQNSLRSLRPWRFEMDSRFHGND